MEIFEPIPTVWKLIVDAVKGVPYSGWTGFSVFLIAHYIGDFFFQSRDIATSKSSSNLSLSIHVAIYTATILAFSFLVDFTSYQRSVFVIYNGLVHFLTDYTTSRITTAAYKKGDMTKFWDTVGFDQFIHIYTLYVLYGMLINK